MKVSYDCFTVAIPVHQGRISPLFDAARRVLIVEIAGGEEHSRREIDMPDGECRDQLSTLRTLGVEALVCGAISNRSLSEAMHLGLRVWSAVAGEAEEVISSLALTGNLSLQLAMTDGVTPRYCGDLAWAGGNGPRIWGWRGGTGRMAGESRCG